MKYSIDFHKMQIIADHGNTVQLQLEADNISCSLAITKELFKNSSEVGVYIKNSDEAENVKINNSNHSWVRLKSKYNSS